MEKQSIETSLKGMWKNELGSILMITNISNGKFEGKYLTQVSAIDKPLESQILGYYGENSDFKEILITFIAKWQYVKDGINISSVTSWNGTFKGERISAIWLLTRTDNSPHNWNSTMTNKDIFIKMETIDL